MTHVWKSGPLSKSTTALVICVFALSCVASFLAYPTVEARLLGRAQETSKSTLRLVSDAVDQAMGQYAPLPALIAVDPVFPALLNDAENAGLIPFINEKLRHIAGSIAASDIYVMDTTGTTIAASNYRDTESFVGQNFSYRPYYQQAVSGQTARFHALGITSGERGFFFAAPILDGINVIGVLVVKVTVDLFESTWSGLPRDVLVADPNGVVFLSSRPEYRLRTLLPLSDGSVTQIRRTRQFPLEAVLPIPFSAHVIAPSAVEVTLGEGEAQVQSLSLSEPLDLAGWHAIVLTPTRPIRAQAIYVLAVWNLAILAVILAAIVVIQRRARIRERLRVEQTQRDLLEQMVQARTMDLDAANTSLRSEVIDRKAAEDRLRRTQKDLVQAGKLAALGQMSAAISHEINQPLSAVKSYADNAAQYLRRQRTEEVRANLIRISQMTDRIAKISGHLRNFARRPGDTLSAIPLCEVIREATALMEPQLRTCGGQLTQSLPDAEIWAMGGRLRLQQVLMNIMTNAVDAMSDQDEKHIDISIEPGAETVSVLVRDHGPGVPQDALGQVFEAFFTTKTAGAGMGLGLSISYNIIEDFGGKLTASNHPEGGGVFSVVLRRAEAPDQTPGRMVAE